MLSPEMKEKSFEVTAHTARNAWLAALTLNVCLVCGELRMMGIENPDRSFSIRKCQFRPQFMMMMTMMIRMMMIVIVMMMVVAVVARAASSTCNTFALDMAGKVEFRQFDHKRSINPNIRVLLCFTDTRGTSKQNSFWQVPIHQVCKNFKLKCYNMSQGSRQDFGQIQHAT